LKQARQRVSRRFLKDGARSSLPQYRQTKLSELEAARDDRAGCCGAFVVFVARATFGLIRADCFFPGVADLPLCVSDPSGAGLASVFK
jgi:hypothetical protein